MTAIDNLLAELGWTKQHHLDATREGWGLFTTDGGKLMIQRYDDVYNVLRDRDLVDETLAEVLDTALDNLDSEDEECVRILRSYGFSQLGSDKSARDKVRRQAAKGDPKSVVALKAHGTRF